MSVEKIVVDVFKSGIDLYVEKGMLAYEVKKGGLSDDVRAVLKENKQEIIHYLLNNRVDTNSEEKPADGEASGIVLLNSNTSKNTRPLFLAHEDSGLVFYYSYLAKALEEQFPVYGLQIIGSELSLNNLTMRTLALKHIESMKKIQPKGPYRIAGWSAAGGVAYEIAHQLLGSGEQVEFLGLLDFSHSYDVADNAVDNGFIDALLQTADKYFNIDFDLFSLKSYIRDVKKVPLYSDGQIEEMKSMPIIKELAQSLAKSGWELDDFFEQVNVYHAMSLLSMEYRPPALPIEVNLFYATVSDEPDTDDSTEPHLEEGPSDLEALHQAWKELQGDNIKFTPADGDHETMIQTPYVNGLADSIVTEIKKVKRIKEINNVAGSNISDSAFLPIVHIQKGKDAHKPLICVPGSALTPVSFLELVQALDDDIPVAAIQHSGLDKHTVPFSSVEKAAEYYIKKIKASYPVGPYRFLGHSFGGWIAYEMAAQLMSQGDQVELLVVLDSRHPGAGNQAVKMSRTDHLIELVNIFTQNHDSRIALSRETIVELNETEQLKLLVDLLPIDVDVQSMRSIVNAFIVNSETHYNQDFKFCNKAFLINATEEKGEASSGDDNINGWKKHLPTMDVIDLPGNHMSILKKPVVDEIGSLLSSLLK